MNNDEHVKIPPVSKRKAVLMDPAELVRLEAEVETLKTTAIRFAGIVREFYHFAAGDDIDRQPCLGVCDGCSGHGDCEAELARELKALETLCKE